MKSIAFSTALLVVACSPSSGDEDAKIASTLSVYTVNEPLRYFASRIGGNAVDVVLPASLTGDPAYWRPGPATIARYQAAQIILLNGAGYARWTETASLPEDRIVLTSRGASNRYIPISGTTTHRHGPTGEHTHTGTAFTVWLDPEIAKVQVETIAAAFAFRSKEHSRAFGERRDQLLSELAAFGQKLQTIVAADPQRPLLGSHPVYQYLARYLGLNLKSLHWEPDQMPAEEQWKELEVILQSHPAKAMLWEDTPDQKIASRLKELGVQSVVYSPCATRPEGGDFMARMQENAAELQRAFR